MALPQRLPSPGSDQSDKHAADWVVHHKVGLAN
ncbi:hypothetical protein TSMEX_006643 [Taenia solium]